MAVDKRLSSVLSLEICSSALLASHGPSARDPWPMGRSGNGWFEKMVMQGFKATCNPASRRVVVRPTHTADVHFF